MNYDNACLIFFHILHLYITWSWYMQESFETPLFLPWFLLIEFLQPLYEPSPSSILMIQLTICWSRVFKMSSLLKDLKRIAKFNFQNLTTNFQAQFLSNHWSFWSDSFSIWNYFVSSFHSHITRPDSWSYEFVVPFWSWPVI